ncbi:hypothetical protein RRA80_02745, partial [Streptococcus pneumoniae]|nr:hypothetical protein [Streptococcus pneumoniae]
QLHLWYGQCRSLGCSRYHWPLFATDQDPPLMSILSVFHTASPALPHKVLTHHDDIAATLAEHGVRFEHAEPGVRVRPGTAQDEVLAACRAYLDQLMTAQGSKA